MLEIRENEIRMDEIFLNNATDEEIQMIKQIYRDVKKRVDKQMR